jgi:D-alanine-D-alanine ligase
MGRKVRVGIVFGGRSGEHEVSLMSAQGVMQAIDKDKYEVVPIGITKEGRWLASGDPMKALSSGVQADSQHAALLPEPMPQGLIRLEEREQHLAAVQMSQIDVVFPVLHGPYGEDGTVQGLLELAGIPYVGAGVTASAVGMDKAVFKDVVRAHGLPVVPFLVIKRKALDRNLEQVVDWIEAEIGYDCFVKPANLGSSVGISKAHDREELYAALVEAARYDRKLLVEVAVDAREIEVSLLIPAPIPDETAEAIRQMAVAAYLAIDCAGMARVDFLLERTTGQVYLNEVNTLPGFTSISMFSRLWEATGISYPDLIDRLIELALERHDDKSRSATSYQPREKD